MSLVAPAVAPSPGLVALSATRTDLYEAIQGVAGAIHNQHIVPGRRGLAFCGTASGVGVSFMAANVAVLLAQSGLSTLLVDANLRRPSLGAYFPSADPVPGLQQYLRTPSVEFADILRPDVLEGLSFVPAGGEAEDAQELLTSGRFKAFLRLAMREFQCTIVDAPAANRSADARLIASAVGYALIVARSGATYVDDVEQFANEITTDGAVVVGSILNGV